MAYTKATVRKASKDISAYIALAGLPILFYLLYSGDVQIVTKGYPLDSLVLATFILLEIPPVLKKLKKGYSKIK